jgi:hypothetical protein
VQDNTAVTWENKECELAGALHPDNIKALRLPKAHIIKGVIWFLAEVNFRFDFLMLDEMEVEQHNCLHVEQVMIECFASQVWDASEDDIYFLLFSQKSEYRHHHVLAFYCAMLGWKSVMNMTKQVSVPTYDSKKLNQYTMVVHVLEQ